MITKDEEAAQCEESPAHHKRSHLYRTGSQYGSQALGGDLELKERHHSTAESGNEDRKSTRSRKSSGRSIRSRTATRAEYHEDLKSSLAQSANRNLLFQGFVIVMGTSFIFGYNIGVLNQPVDLIQGFYNSTYSRRRQSQDDLRTNNNNNSSNSTDNFDGVYEADSGEVLDKYTLTFLWSLTTTVFVIGGMIGAYSAGFVADRLGRKRATLLSLVPAFLGAFVSCACVRAASPEILMIGRFLTGIHCGAATQLAPMYLLEIAPYNLKGAFGTASQLFITIGIFIGSVLGLSNILGKVDTWPYLLLLNAVPAGLCLVCLPFLPESPRYLMLIKRNRIAAEKALRFVRRATDVLADIEEMETELNDSEKKQDVAIGGGSGGGVKEKEDYSMLRLLKSHDLRKPLLIACFLNVIQQLSGINAVFFYSTGIYMNAGVAKVYIEYAVIITNLVNVIMTIVAVPVMDRAGRRPLLLFPMGAMVIILGLITVALTTVHHLKWMSFISIACVLAYVICFAVGLGPIPMMIAAELFRQGPRPRAMSLAGLTNWFFTAIIAISFELIQQVTKDYTFLIFFVLMIGFTLFVYFLVPETRNKTFEEIASQFQPGGEIEVDEVIEDAPYIPTSVFDDDINEARPHDKLMISSNGTEGDNALDHRSNHKIDGAKANGYMVSADEQKSLMRSEEQDPTV